MIRLEVLYVIYTILTRIELDVKGSNHIYLQAYQAPADITTYGSKAQTWFQIQIGVFCNLEAESPGR